LYGFRDGDVFSNIPNVRVRAGSSKVLKPILLFCGIIDVSAGCVRAVAPPEGGRLMVTGKHVILFLPT